MSTGPALGLMAASVFAVALVWVFVTRRSGRSAVRWMRPIGEDIAHAVPIAELESDLPDVQPLARCAQWPVPELVRDDRAERCRACVCAVERLEHRHR